MKSIRLTIERVIYESVLVPMLIIRGFDPKGVKLRLGEPMLPYDPEDSTIKLSSDLVGIVEQSVAHLSPIMAENVEIVANQARRACECEEHVKKDYGGKAYIHREIEDICLPCEARAALNSISDIAERG